jgi:hypothetical protein
LISDPLVPKVEYTTMLLGATGNVGAHPAPARAKPAVSEGGCRDSARRRGARGPKVQQVVVNMDTMEKELAPHAKGVDIGARGVRRR